MTIDVKAIDREQVLVSSDCSLILSRIEALRDFFCARDRFGLESAYIKATERCSGQSGEPIDWQVAEYDFNRLFVGPSSPEAPPYASVYIDEAPDLMGGSTLNIRRLYASLHLEVPEKGTVPDDFISYELDALLVIVGRQPLDIAALKRLISEHMIKWVPKFCQRCRRSQKISHPVLTMVNQLESTINYLAQSISDEAISEN